ncbi:hypothetical protein WAI453_004444 [Rhynchosporium graminicola]
MPIGEYVLAAEHLGLVVGENVDETKSIDALRIWLSGTDHILLLVFVNVESKDSSDTFWPPSMNGSLMITTQHAEVASAVGERCHL